MSLYSGEWIHSNEWKELPIDGEVVSIVEELAEAEEAPKIKHGYPIFTWKQYFLDDPELSINDAIEVNLPIKMYNDWDIDNDLEKNVGDANNINEDRNKIPSQEFKLENNKNNLLIDGEPIQDETNYITDGGTINGKNSVQDKRDSHFDGAHVMDEIPEENVADIYWDHHEKETMYYGAEEIMNENIENCEDDNLDIESNSSRGLIQKCASKGIE